MQNKKAAYKLILCGDKRDRDANILSFQSVKSTNEKVPGELIMEVQLQTETRPVQPWQSNERMSKHVTRGTQVEGSSAFSSCDGQRLPSRGDTEVSALK